MPTIPLRTPIRLFGFNIQVYPYDITITGAMQAPTKVFLPTNFNG